MVSSMKNCGERLNILETIFIMKKRKIFSSMKNQKKNIFFFVWFQQYSQIETIPKIVSDKFIHTKMETLKEVISQTLSPFRSIKIMGDNIATPIKK